MRDELQVKRWIEHVIPSLDLRGLVLLTGARQTGKTTAARKCYPSLPYFNLDAVEFRDQLSAVSSFSWAETVGNAVLDEVQKEPSLLDKIKFAYDEQGIDFSALLGSAQILLLKNVRETLAGRVFVFELFPLMLSELATGDAALQPPLIECLLKSDDPSGILKKTAPVLLGPIYERLLANEQHLLNWGGMPGLLPLNEMRRRQWLKSYEMTYLERDLGDLARLDDLKPFRRFQKLTALRSGHLLSFSELARDAGVAVETARRYMEYLRLSYQAFLIYPFSENLTSQVVKTPKVFWADCGLCRSLTGRTPDAPVDGHLFETYIAGELIKLLRTKQLDAQLFYYRTRSGMEVDFLLQTPGGILAVEVKNRKQVDGTDTGAMKAVASALGKRWRGGFVVYRGNRIEELSDSIWAIPSVRLFC